MIKIKTELKNTYYQNQCYNTDNKKGGEYNGKQLTEK